MNRDQILLNILQCTKQPPQQRTVQSKMSIVPRLRNPPQPRIEFESLSFKIQYLPLSSIFPCCHNGVHECAGWYSQEYQQRWKERQIPGAYKAVLQSHHQVSNCEDEAWLHGWILNHRWSQGWENCCEHTGRINKCGVISLRFDVRLKDLEKWQNNLLPPHQFGFIVLKTWAGMWTIKKQDKTQ